MSRGKNQMSQVVTQAENTGAALVRITEAIGQIELMTKKITVANKQQSIATDDVDVLIFSTSVSYLKKTGADSDRILEASEELERLASSLKEETTRFKT